MVCLCRKGDSTKLVISMHNTPLAVWLFGTNVGIGCGDLLSRAIPVSLLARKKSSMTLDCSFGSGHCRMTNYLVLRPIQIHAAHLYLEVRPRVGCGIPLSEISESRIKGS